MKFHSLTKMLTVGLIAVVTAALLAGCGSESSQKKFLNIATGGTAGTYYPIGGAMAEILNKEIPGMNASAQSTGATVANINMLKDNSVDLAIVQNDITYYAVNGTEMFKDKKVDNIRGIASLYPETCQFVTLDKSGIKSINELKGKRVAVGAAGSGAEANARQILEAYGITYDDIDVQYLSFAEGASALKDGNVDAAFLTAGYPTSSVQDIASQNKVRLLPVDADKAEALIAKYPFYTKTTIPAARTPASMRRSRRSPSWRCSSRRTRSTTRWAMTSRRPSSRISTACRPLIPSASSSRRTRPSRACRCR